MKGIKARLLKSFVAVILLTVIIFEFILIISIRQYYYGNVEEILLKQAEISANFYRQYLAQDYILQKSVDVLMESFSAATAAQVQIIDSDARLLGDSSGVEAGETIDFPDVTKALSGLPAKWQGVEPRTGEPVMAVSYPLKSGDSVAGAVRFVTSLDGINNVIVRVTFILILMGLTAVMISILAAIILSQTIIRPVKEITAVAEEMARGKFTARAARRYNDEISSLADTLNFMAQEIMRQEKLKNEFIASISHELRTPLTAIKGWAITLLSSGAGISTEDGKFFPGNKSVEDNIDLEPGGKASLNSDELIEGLEVIAKESDRLSELVEELLDFSRLEAGRIKLNLDKVIIADVLNYIKTQMIQRARRQGIEFTVSTQDDLGPITADENRLKQVLINLLDNAFKYTPPGGKVGISAISGSDHVVLSVEDTGCGISSEDLPYVTRKFYKGKGKQPGSGLGLAICDELIKLHGGRMEIKSVPGKGTRVDIILQI
ncbi:MAG TPA: HAMP domain-containing histidine kinase [Thermoanaerobacterales bacterium]|nr:HAMP domain-containing histidine kinase [Thermoanaerobacterales bacterium]